LHRLKGELQLTLRNPDAAAAEACLQRAISIAREQGARTRQLRAATSLARVWHDQAKRAEARNLLAPVYAEFTEGFGMADLDKARIVLEELA
jgi:predicted ATPase